MQTGTSISFSFLSFMHVAQIAGPLYTLGGLAGTVCGLVVFFGLKSEDLSVLWPHMWSCPCTCMCMYRYLYLEVDTLSLHIYRDKGSFTFHTT